MKLKDYIPKFLKKNGIEDFFAIPGDYNLLLLDSCEKVLNPYYCVNELNMSYQADGYARSKGIAVFITTFSVGGLSAINGFAGCVAEKRKVIHISCGPRESKKCIFHHTIDKINTNYVYEAYKKISGSYKINKPNEITTSLKKAFESNQSSYIEIPLNMLELQVENVMPKINSLSSPKNIGVIGGKKPLIIFGGKTHMYHDKLEKIKCPYVIMPDAKGWLLRIVKTFLVCTGLL